MWLRKSIGVNDRTIFTFIDRDIFKSIIFAVELSFKGWDLTLGSLIIKAKSAELPLVDLARESEFLLVELALLLKLLALLELVELLEELLAVSFALSLEQAVKPKRKNTLKNAIKNLFFIKKTCFLLRYIFII